MKFTLDTHTLIWLSSSPEKLSPKAYRVIKNEIKKNKVAISSFTIWEICLLIKKKKIQFNLDVPSWISELEKVTYFQFISVSNRIAYQAATLPGDFHKDPADRFIVATAQELGTTLITKDERIRRYEHVQSLW